MFSLTGTSLKYWRTTESGLILAGIIPNGTIPTTASTFALGAEILDISDGKKYINTGTVAAPVWSYIGSQDILESNVQKVVEVTVTAAQLIAMYTTPVEIVPAVAGKMHVVDSVEFVMTRTSTAFTGGGVVALQYDDTANGAGTLTHATIAATVVTGAAGTTYTARIPVVLSDVASAAAAGIGLFLSNQTAVFAAGTGTARVIVRYHSI